MDQGRGIAHWFVFIAFGALFFTLITAVRTALLIRASRCRSLRALGRRTSGPAAEIIACGGY